jgi:predicted MFS family arabinose efflux permease
MRIASSNVRSAPNSAPAHVTWNVIAARDDGSSILIPSASEARLVGSPLGLVISAWLHWRLSRSRFL